MESNATILKVLRDLLKINRERVEGYKKASQNTDDPGLKAMFLNMADQGRKNVIDIINEIATHNGSSESEATYADRIYGAWANFKTKFSDNSIKNVLTSCESMESAALYIYQRASSKAFSVGMVKLIEKHELSLKSSHEVIRVYRQAYLKLDKMYS